jgi:hypothetical protein
VGIVGNGQQSGNSLTLAKLGVLKELSEEAL